MPTSAFPGIVGLRRFRSLLLAPDYLLELTSFVI